MKGSMKKRNTKRLLNRSLLLRKSPIGKLTQNDRPVDLIARETITARRALVLPCLHFFFAAISCTEDAESLCLSKIS